MQSHINFISIFIILHIPCIERHIKLQYILPPERHPSSLITSSAFMILNVYMNSKHLNQIMIALENNP